MIGRVTVAGTTPPGVRMRGLIVVLWRAGLRIHEALALTEADLDARRGSVLVRRATGGRRREAGMDDGAWEQRQQWLDVRVEMAREASRSIVIQRQLGDTNLSITSIYLQASTAPKSSTPFTPAARQPCR